MDANNVLLDLILIMKLKVIKLCHLLIDDNAFVYYQYMITHLT